MPSWFFILVVFIFGAIIGSFLKVVVDRLHTGKSLNDRSRCFSCGVTLSWKNLFPFFSFIVQRGRCSDCGARIPLSNFLVEVLVALLFVLVFLTSESAFELVALLIFVSLLVVGIIYDLFHLIIPDEISATVAGIGTVIAAHGAYVAGEPMMFLKALVAGVTAFIFFGFFWWYSDGRWMGLGDAKLALGLAVPLGLMGAFSMVVLAFWVGTLITLGMILAEALYLHIQGRGGQRLRAKMKSEVPFGPFLAIAFALVYFFNIDVLTLFSTIFPSV